jgi:hypothetical protein
MEQTIMFIMFQFLFMKRLLVTLQTLLGEPGDIRSLAARADRQLVGHSQAAVP